MLFALSSDIVTEGPISTGQGQHSRGHESVI